MATWQRLINPLLKHANITHPNINFIQECSKTTLPFLDVSVQIEQDKIFAHSYLTLETHSYLTLETHSYLTLETHSYLTLETHSYLHYTSCHPVQIRGSIIYSQFRRYKRICTSNTDFIEHSKELATHLLHKAYPIKVFTKQ